MQARITITEDERASVITAIACRPFPITIGEIVKTSGLPRSRALRILGVMVEEGFLLPVLLSGKGQRQPVRLCLRV